MDTDILKNIWHEWQIEKQIGRGSFGVVYKAVRRDHNVESYAAIKVISIPSDPSEIDSLRSEGFDEAASKTYFHGIVNDFVNEIQLMESLKGMQNIVGVEDYKVVERTDEIGWDIYIRMELLTSFNSYICDKKLTEEEVIKLGCDICTALEICSQRNIIHRDIKPENIFINAFGCFKLGDFGIARKLENMTGGLSQKGTYNYMAPEVANSNEYDASVDVYSLGIVLYRLLNENRLPFLDTDKQLLNPNERKLAVERRIRGEELPPPCGASPEMANLILRACAFDPSARFASATEMKQALMSISNGNYKIVTDGLSGTVRVRQAPKSVEPISTPKVNTFGNAPKKKSKVPKIIAALLVILLIGGAGVFFAPKLMDMIQSNDNSNTNEDDAQYSAYDEEQIANMIAEADAMAAVDDYEGALTKVKTGLAAYPKSQALKDKETEYTDALNARIKQSVLDEAEKFAQAEDYISAMAVIKNAQDTYGDNTDYNAAYTRYEKAQTEQIKQNVLSEAAKFAQTEDYISAMAVIKNAQDTYGDNADYSTAYSKYEKAQAEQIKQSVLTEAEKFAQSEDYMSAMAVIKNAQDSYGDNADYHTAYTRYENAYATQMKAKVLSEAEALANGGNYAAAMATIKTAQSTYGNDSDYQTAYDSYSKLYKEQVKTEALQKADALAQSGDYASAVKILEDAQTNIGVDVELTQKIQEYTAASGDAAADAQKQSVLATAKAYADKEDYLSAMNTIKTAMKDAPTDEDYKDAYNDYAKFYEYEVLNQASDLADDKSYDDAISVLENAKTNLPTSTKIPEAIEKYKNLKATADTQGSQTGKEDVPTGTIRDGEELNVVGGASKEAATEIGLENINYGEFTTSGDAWYKVTTSSNYSVYRFKLENRSIDTTIYVTVYDEYNTYLDSNGCNINGTEYVDLQLDTNNTYYIKISRRNDDYLGHYKLTVEEHICDAGASQEKAFSILLDKTYVKSFDVAGYDDWYKVTTSSNYSVYRFKLENMSIDTTIYVEVYDEYNTYLGGDGCTINGTEYVDLQLDTNNTYYIKISRSNDNRLGHYKLTVEEHICDAGASQEKAFSILLDKTYVKSFDVAGYDDWYKVTTSSNYSVYRFILENRSIDTTIYVEVYDEYNTYLGGGECYINGTEYVDLQLDTNNTYYIKISRQYITYLGHYNLTVEEHICDAGITKEEAFPIALNKTNIGVFDVNKDDWYVCTVTESGTYNISFTNHNIDSKTNITIYDMLGSQLYCNGVYSGDSLTLLYEMPAGTVLHICISRNDSSKNGNYSIAINKQ